MRRQKRFSRGTTRRLLLSAVVCLLALPATPVLGGGSAAAKTNRVTLMFDEGYVKLGGLEDGVEVVDLTKPARLKSDMTAGGAFTIRPANFGFPPYTEDDVVPGVDLKFDLAPLGDVTGKFNPVTGRLTTNAANYAFAVTLTGAVEGSCTISPVPLVFSTEAEPLADILFHGLEFEPYGVPADGTIAAGWASLPVATGGPACAALDILAAGPGAIELSNEEDGFTKSADDTCKANIPFVRSIVARINRARTPGGVAAGIDALAGRFDTVAINLRIPYITTQPLPGTKWAQRFRTMTDAVRRSGRYARSGADAARARNVNALRRHLTRADAALGVAVTNARRLDLPSCVRIFS